HLLSHIGITILRLPNTLPLCRGPGCRAPRGCPDRRRGGLGGSTAHYPSSGCFQRRCVSPAEGQAGYKRAQRAPHNGERMGGDEGVVLLVVCNAVEDFAVEPGVVGIAEPPEEPALSVRLRGVEPALLNELRGDERVAHAGRAPLDRGNDDDEMLRRSG